VKEQTGLFAGGGGYDIRVGDHTQLDGAVISSTGAADKNRLDTGTLGWSDIDNQAHYKTEHQSAGFNSGGPVGSNLLSNVSALPLSGSGSEGRAEGTTKAAVSAGTVVLRDRTSQKQDVSTLNRDAEHANDGSIAPIFNKEKEQKRLQQAQLIGEIGSQAADIALTQGQIVATKAASEKMKNVTAEQLEAAKKAWMAANPGKTPTADDISGQAYNALYNQAFTDSGYGTGGKVQQAIQAATAAVQGLAGGDIAKAIAGGSAPYIAEVIKQTAPDEASRVMAHAVVAGVIAQLQGNSAAAGAVGAASAAVSTAIIAKAMYGTDDFSKLDETQKQTISALATLASGLAGGVAGGDASGAVAGAQAGKNTSENNDMGLPTGLMNYCQAVASWDQYAQDNNLTPEQKQAGLDKLAQGDLPEGANITKVIVNGYKDGVLIAGAAYLGPAASVGKVVGGAVIAKIANGTYQWFDLSQPGNENKTWDYKGSISTGITGALAPGRGVWQNVGMAAGSAVFTDGPDIGSVGGAALGAWAGGKFGELAPFLGEVNDLFGGIGGEIISNKVKDKINEN
jgi:filamentous hemagglutinin